MHVKINTRQTRSSDVITIDVDKIIRIANLRCADNMFTVRAAAAWNAVDSKIRMPELVYQTAKGVSFDSLLYKCCTKSANHRLK